MQEEPLAPPERTRYTTIQELRNLLAGIGADGRPIHIGDRRRRRMTRRLEQLEAQEKARR